VFALGGLYGIIVISPLRFELMRKRLYCWRFAKVGFLPASAGCCFPFE